MKLVFTSPGYTLVTKYSAPVEFKTWSGPSWAKGGFPRSLFFFFFFSFDGLSNTVEGNLVIFHSGGMI